METRANTAAAPIEAGSVLRYRYCDKMQETLNMITRRPLTVAVLADTHLREDDTSVMDEIMARETPLRAWSAAGVEVDGRCRAGVTVVWDPAEHELVDAGKVLVDGRVVRVVLRDAQSRQCTAVYGVYMPVRGQGTEVDELVRECFDALDDALAAETHARVAVGGDFNAETAEWAERRTRRTVSDERLAELIDDHALVPQARGATFRPETVGTQIDNWLVRAAMAAEMGAAHTIPGVSGDDHHALEMQEKAAANEESGRGPERPKGSPACKFDEDDEKQFKEEVRDEYIMKGGCMEGATRRWDEELRIFQAAAMQLAYRLKQREEGDGNVSTARRLGEREQEMKREALRGWVAKWSRITAHVHGWNGGKMWQDFWRSTEALRDDAALHRAGASRKEKAQRAREICRAELAKASQAFASSERAGDRVIEDMEKAVVAGKGACMYQMFEILRRALGQTTTQGERLAAMYEGDDPKPSGLSWRKTEGAQRASKEINSRELVAVLRETGGTLSEEQRVRALDGIKLEDSSWVKVDGECYSPEPRRVVTGPELKEEVKNAATKINARKEIDMRAVDSLLKLAGESKTVGTVRAAELCSWPACARAIAKAKKGKGMGIDGFDGYLVKLMPVEMQQRYSEILRGIVSEKHVPMEWNQWIAVLAVKPGEDPKQLSRRRDLWLQCHSLKCVMRMMAVELDRAAEWAVAVSQAGFTPDRNAPEQTMVARMLSKAAAEDRVMDCAAYIDLGVAFMSISFEVARAVERWSGVATEVSEVLTYLREGLGEAEAGTLPPLTGQYETAFGLTDPVAVLSGLGQGELTSPTRCNLVMNVMTRAVQKMVPGRTCRTARARVPTLFYADDGRLQSDDVQTLKLALESVWMFTRVLGMDLQVKEKRKCAWSAYGCVTTPKNVATPEPPGVAWVE